MEIDTSNLTDEQISKLSEFVHTMEKENKATKWWIMPKYPVFSSEVQQFGQSYYVEPQRDSYSRSKPPLKSDFSTKEEAQKWLDDYRKEEDLFLKAKDELKVIATKKYLETHKTGSLGTVRGEPAYSREQISCAFSDGYYAREKEISELEAQEDNKYSWGQVEEGYEQGYLSGYRECQKEHEWHYPSKGELPKEDTAEKEMLYLLWFGIDDSDYMTGVFSHGRFWCFDCGWFDVKEVIAWKEIVPPSLDKGKK